MLKSVIISGKGNIKSLFNKLVIILAFFFLPTSILAQVNIYGDWRINDIFGIRDAKEYSMVRQDENNRWGRLFTLNLDGTFLSRNLPQCGNDIYWNVSGNFILIDDTHIRLIIRKTSSTSFEKQYNSESEPNKDLGIFYIYKDSKSIQLIESNGILQDDNDKMLYTEMAKSFDENWKSYDYSWQNTKANTPEEIIKDCVDNRKQVDFSNSKVVFSKQEGYGKLFLVKENNNFHFVLYDDYKKKVSLAYPRLIE